MKVGLSAVSVFSVIALSFFGCSRQGEKPRSFDNLKATDVVLELNGVKQTKADFEFERQLRLALLKAALSEGQYRKMEKSAPDSIFKGLLDSKIQDLLLLGAADAYFKTNKTASAETELAFARAKVADTFSVKGTNGVAKTMEQIAAALSDDDLRRRFAAKVDENVRVEAYLCCAYPGELRLSDAQISNALVRLAQYNVRVLATNRVQYAAASNVWRKAMSGEDFATLADRFSQDPDKEAGGAMGECTKNDFSDDPDLWSLIVRQKEGAVLPPRQTGNGLEIYRINKVIASDEDGGGEDPEVSVELSRIFFRLGVECKDYTIEEYRAEMEPYNRMKRMQQVLMREWKAATLKFPYGSDILPSTVWCRLPGFPKEKGGSATTKK